PPGARDRAARRCPGGRAPAALRRPVRPPHRRPPAREARRGGGAVPHTTRRASHARRLARRRYAGDTIRGRDSVRPLAARLPRPTRGGPGARRGATGRVAERPSGLCLVSSHGRGRHLSRARGAVGRMACLAARGPSAQSLAPAGSRARHADGLRGRRGGVDGHRAGSPAVGDLRRLEDPGRRHADAGVGRAVCHLHAALLLPRRDCRLAPVPTHHPQSGGAGVARILHGTRERGAGSGEQHVTLADILAGIVFVALNAYAVLGGADFGGGVWDLLALGPRRERQRELIAEAIGPVWEANHVWLILAIVLLFTCFPPAFARLGTLLHIPLSLVLIGIVLRGSAFTFWRYGSPGGEDERRWGVVFAIASLMTPLLLGTAAGAIASGALGDGGRGSGDFYDTYVAPWLNPFALSVGLFALIAFAFLAAVYLTLEARERELQEDFRRRA